MRIMIGGIEAFSRSYRTYDEFMDEYVDYMNERGHQVPDYDMSVLLPVLTQWLLGVVGERAIKELADELQRGKEEEEANELNKARHLEKMDEIGELARAIQDVRETPRRAESGLIEDGAVRVPDLLRLAKKENIRIDVVLETEAEGDLKEPFEGLMKDVPGSITRD